MNKIVNLLLEEIVELVLDKVEGAKGDDFFAMEVRRILEDGLMNKIELSFWENLDSKQAEHFEQFLEGRYVIDPDIDEKLIIIDFAGLYPTLLEAIHLDILIFLEEFVERFDD